MKVVEEMTRDVFDRVDEKRPMHLSLTAQEMRKLGYAAVDMLVEHYNGIECKPVIDDLEWRPDDCVASMPFSNQGRDPHELLLLARDDIFGHSMQMNHPRFFAYVPGAGNFVGAVADQLSSGFNVSCVTNQGNLGPVTVERKTVAWLCEQFGLPNTAGGLFTSGGSAANLIALTAARHIALADSVEDAVVYCTSETHRCIGRALFILGFRNDQMHSLETNECLQMDPAHLAEAIEEDRDAGKIPFCVAASAGTTSSGSVDPLDQIAEICERESLWLHVDAAFGGGAILTRRGRDQMRGIERAKSIAVDPHKWFFQPYECGCVLVRDPVMLYDTFQDLAVYETDTDGGSTDINYRDMGLQRSRNFKAFKLWLSLQVFGVDAFRRAVDHGLDLAEMAERILRARKHWHVVTPAKLGIITFQYRPPGLSEVEVDQLNEQMTNAMCRSGYAYMSTTQLFGRKVQRLCLNRLDAIETEITETIKKLELIAQDFCTTQ